MIPVQFRSFETRIVVFFFLLLTAVQVAAFLVVSTTYEAIAKREIASQISVGVRVFERTFEQNGRQLAQVGAMLAADPGFRDALAARNPTTITALLERHGARINASVVMLIDLDNKLLADSRQGFLIGQPFPFPELVSAAGQTQRASAVVIINHQPYQLVVVPALAPLPIAWVAMGFKIDDKLAQDMRALTTLRVSFLTEQSERQWNVSASTLPQSERDQLSGRMAELVLAQARDVTMSILDQEYQTHTHYYAHQNRGRTRHRRAAAVVELRAWSISRDAGDPDRPCNCQYFCLVVRQHRDQSQSGQPDQEPRRNRAPSTSR